MKSYDITLFVVILSMTIALFNVILIPASSPLTPEISDITAYTLPDTADQSGGSILVAVSILAFMAFTLIPALLILFLKVALIIPITMNDVGVHPLFTAMVVTLLFIVYTAGALQMWLNRNIVSSE